jgi:hypothetical protein
VRRAGLLCLVALAGCGGGDDGGDRDAYVASGDAICRDYEAAIGKLDQPVELGDIGPYIADALPVLERTAGRIEALDPPADLRDEFAAFRDAARQTVTRAEALRRAAEQGDSGEVERLLDEAGKASERRVGLARAAGLDACADI